MRPSGVREKTASPVLELVDVVRRLVAEDLDRILVAEPVGALDGVEGVLLGVVLGGVAERRVDAAFGRAGVAAGRMDLREKRDVGARVERLDRCPHAGEAGSDDEDVVLRVTCPTLPHARRESAACRYGIGLFPEQIRCPA